MPKFEIEYRRDDHLIALKTEDSIKMTFQLNDLKELVALFSGLDNLLPIEFESEEEIKNRMWNFEDATFNLNSEQFHLLHSVDSRKMGELYTKYLPPAPFTIDQLKKWSIIRLVGCSRVSIATESKLSSFDKDIVFTNDSNPTIDCIKDALPLVLLSSDGKYRLLSTFIINEKASEVLKNE